MFLNYINNFRGIAIFYIVAIHTVSAFEWAGHERLYKILMAFFSNGTVLFVFIAGYLFQHLSKKFVFSRYFRKKILYVGLPYIICSVPAVLYFTFVEQRWDLPLSFYDNPKYIQILDYYLTGAQLAPYWFIPMIFMYYAISFVFVYLDRKGYLYYFLPLLMAVSLAVARGELFQNFVYFLSVYTAGMFCSHYRDTVTPLVSKGAFISVSGILVLAMTITEYMGLSCMSYFQKMFLCLFLLGVLYRYDEKIGDRFSLLATTSFGIYFIHSYLISFVKEAALKANGKYFPGSLTGYIIFTGAVMFVCVMIILGLQKILKGKSRYIVGS